MQVLLIISASTVFSQTSITTSLKPHIVVVPNSKLLLCLLIQNFDKCRFFIKHCEYKIKGAVLELF